MKAEIQHAVDFQERIGLDIFVHGEPGTCLRADSLQWEWRLIVACVLVDV